MKQKDDNDLNLWFKARDHNSYLINHWQITIYLTGVIHLFSESCLQDSPTSRGAGIPFDGDLITLKKNLKMVLPKLESAHVEITSFTVIISLRTWG